MKKLFLAALFLLGTVSVYASFDTTTTTTNTTNNTYNSTTNNYVADGSSADNAYGVKLDAPDLIIINDNTSVGVEVSKNLNQTSADEGYAVYTKVTVKWNLFDFRKKGE